MDMQIDEPRTNDLAGRLAIGRLRPVRAHRLDGTPDNHQPVGMIHGGMTSRRQYLVEQILMVLLLVSLHSPARLYRLPLEPKPTNLSTRRKTDLAWPGEKVMCAPRRGLLKGQEGNALLPRAPSMAPAYRLLVQAYQ
jgi:hypothetical protein